MDETRLRQDLEQHHPMSYGWALRCCQNDPLEAEDVLQVVYLKILEGRARYEGRSQFKTWLFALIRYTSIDAQRKRRRHSTQRFMIPRRKNHRMNGWIVPGFRIVSDRSYRLYLPVNRKYCILFFMMNSVFRGPPMSWAYRWDRPGRTTNGANSACVN
jgi:hypothetical protein